MNVGYLTGELLFTGEAAPGDAPFNTAKEREGIYTCLSSNIDQNSVVTGSGVIGGQLLGNWALGATLPRAVAATFDAARPTLQGFALQLSAEAAAPLDLSNGIASIQRPAVIADGQINSFAGSFLQNTTDNIMDVMRLTSGKERAKSGAMAVAAVDTQTFNVSFGFASGQLPDLVDSGLHIAASESGVGAFGVRTASGNILGRCAEFNVANNLMLGGSELSDIEFGPAFRPRTLEMHPPCANCQTMFGLGDAGH